MRVLDFQGGLIFFGRDGRLDIADRSLEKATSLVNAALWTRTTLLPTEKPTRLEYLCRVSTTEVDCWYNWTSRFGVSLLMDVLLFVSSLRTWIPEVSC